MYKYRLTFAMTSGHVTSPSQNAPRGQGAQVHSPEHQSHQNIKTRSVSVDPRHCTIKSKPTCQNTYFHSMVLKVIKSTQPTWRHQQQDVRGSGNALSRKDLSLHSLANCHGELTPLASCWKSYVLRETWKSVKSKKGLVLIMLAIVFKHKIKIKKYMFV